MTHLKEEMIIEHDGRRDEKIIFCTHKLFTLSMMV